MIWEVVLAAQKAALEAAKDGVITHVVDDTAREVISNASYGEYFTHRLGHGSFPFAWFSSMQRIY